VRGGELSARVKEEERKLGIQQREYLGGGDNDPVNVLLALG